MARPKLSAPEIRCGILDYYKKHPCAIDTARGIARWWIGCCLHQVEQELDRLVEEGHLERIGEDAEALYRRPISSDLRAS